MTKMDELLKEVNKKFKDEIVHQGMQEYSYSRIPFSSLRLNYMTFGGLPVGRLIEFYGEEHGGKTTSALDIVANYQKLDTGKKVLYCDCENTLDTKWAKTLGVCVEDLYLLQPMNQSAEEIFQIILDSIDTGEIGLVVIDSIGVMISQAGIDKDVTEKTYAGISNALTTFSKKAEMLGQKYKCTIIGINQLRDNFNSMYGGTTTPGGRAWKHNCSVRLEFRRGRFVDEKNNEISRGAENPAGNKIEVAMVKNKTCPPTRHLGFYTLKYLTGIDTIADILDLGMLYGIIIKSGAWFDICNIQTGEIIESKIHGQGAVIEKLKEDEELKNLIESLINFELNNENLS